MSVIILIVSGIYWDGSLKNKVICNLNIYYNYTFSNIEGLYCGAKYVPCCHLLSCFFPPQDN